MLGFMGKKSRQKRNLEFQGWFDELDEESQQETTLKYLRKLDSLSLKRLYETVELYRKADKILKDKVKDPEPEEGKENEEMKGE